MLLLVPLVWLLGCHLLLARIIWILKIMNSIWHIILILVFWIHDVKRKIANDITFICAIGWRHCWDGCYGPWRASKPSYWGNNKYLPSKGNISHLLNTPTWTIYPCLYFEYTNLSVIFCPISCYDLLQPTCMTDESYSNTCSMQIKASSILPLAPVL